MNEIFFIESVRLNFSIKIQLKMKMQFVINMNSLNLYLMKR